MAYEVGTHISFKKKEDRPPEASRRRLYVPGTRILFINWIPTFQTLTIVPAM